MSRSPANALAEQVYARLKNDIFDFRLLPGERFTETAMAEQHQVSRTPMRDALYRLQREGYLEVEFRRGWQVRNLDFAQFDNFYDLRIVLECAALERICQMPDTPAELNALKAIWLVPEDEREKDGRRVAQLDEEFHAGLVAAAGNAEMSRVHGEVTEKIRIIRRLDFTQDKRVDATYNEHAKLLKLVLRRKMTESVLLLRSHITESKLEVRKITLHKLQEAQTGR
ncbi:MAG: GntR family transcriptional regulator [Massilia sp.]